MLIKQLYLIKFLIQKLMKKRKLILKAEILKDKLQTFYVPIYRNIQARTFVIGKR
jgi:hypothetical protein